MVNTKNTWTNNKSSPAENEMTRGRILWSAVRDKRDTEPVSLERAKLITSSYKETEGLPIFIRNIQPMTRHYLC